MLKHDQNTSTRSYKHTMFIYFQIHLKNAIYTEKKKKKSNLEKHCRFTVHFFKASLTVTLPLFYDI